MARQVRPWQVKPFLHRERKAREGDQEPASIFHQGQRHRRTKVRMYGCNLYLLAVMRLSAWQTGGDHVCVKTQSTCHVGAIARDSSQQSHVKLKLRARKCTAPIVPQ